MKSYSKMITVLLLASGLVFTKNAVAQNAAVIEDPQLGQAKFIDNLGFDIDANSIALNNVVGLKLPVNINNHGAVVPAGSCKIKIGLGSKIMLDSSFSFTTTNLNNYFQWTVNTDGGQVQLVGSLVADLPASITSVNMLFKVKPSVIGKSTITANFLITNHNTRSILSDEDGNNNTASLAYQVNEAMPVITGKAINLALYPNPVSGNTTTIIVEAKQGAFNGKYVVNMYDALGKAVKTETLQLVNVKRFNYAIGNIAAGKYVVQVNQDDEKPVVLKLEKL